MYSQFKKKWNLWVYLVLSAFSCFTCHACTAIMRCTIYSVFGYMLKPLNSNFGHFHLKFIFKRNSSNSKILLIQILSWVHRDSNYVDSTVVVESVADVSALSSLWNRLIPACPYTSITDWFKNTKQCNLHWYITQLTNQNDNRIYTTNISVNMDAIYKCFYDTIEHTVTTMKIVKESAQLCHSF